MVLKSRLDYDKQIFCTKTFVLLLLAKEKNNFKHYKYIITITWFKVIVCNFK